MTSEERHKESMFVFILGALCGLARTGLAYILNHVTKMVELKGDSARFQLTTMCNKDGSLLGA